MDGGGGGYGQTCATSADCTDPTYNTCELDQMKMICTKLCQSAADCPNPPTTGTCTPKGFCK